MRIIVAGDVVPCNRVAAQIEKGDFKCLDGIKAIVQSSDYAILNFESPIVLNDAKPIAKAGPRLKCTEQTLECVSKAGFRCITLANNHFRDFGQIGVENTIDSCVKYNIDYVGGGKNQEEARQILYKIIKGQRLAIINYCENEFSICSENHGGSNPLNPVRNFNDIKEARKRADYVLIIVHGGVEGYQFPTPRMLETYRFFVDAGADAVVNHHQHCYSGYEVYQNKPIFYGLGNFCFDRANSNLLWQSGYFVSVDFGEDISFEIYPYLQGTEKKAGVELLKDDGKDVFFDKLGQINGVISNATLLEMEFKKLASSLATHKIIEFEPFRNKYVRALQTRGLLPSFVSRKTRYDTYDMINCESHREILLEVLINEISKNRWNILKK